MPVYSDKIILEQIDNTINMLQGLRNVVLERVDPLPDHEDYQTDESGDIGPGDETDYEPEPEPFQTREELDVAEQVRSIGQDVLGDKWPSGFDDQLMLRVYENCREDLEKVEAVFFVFSDKLENDVVRSPGGLLFSLSRSRNILNQKSAIENRSEEQQVSEAARAAKKRMDEKIKGRPIRGQAAKPKNKPNFKELAEKLYGGGKSASD